MPTAERIDPYRNFRFRVEIDKINIAGFSEVTLSDSSTEPVDYRAGNDPTFVRKLSGLNKFGNLVLKKGVDDTMDLYKWRQQVVDSGATKARKTISIVLIDEEGNDKVKWEVRNAWCSKIEYSGLNATANEVQIETLEIVHEGIKRLN